jgi:hypothetical protein
VATLTALDAFYLQESRLQNPSHKRAGIQPAAASRGAAFMRWILDFAIERIKT